MLRGGSLLGKDGGCVSSGRALSAVTMGGERTGNVHAGSVQTSAALRAGGGRM